MFEYDMFKCLKRKRIKKKTSSVEDYPVQLLMVLIAGLYDRLLTPFSLWLGSIVARPTC